MTRRAKSGHCTEPEAEPAAPVHAPGAREHGRPRSARVDSPPACDAPADGTSRKRTRRGQAIPQGTWSGRHRRVHWRDGQVWIRQLPGRWPSRDRTGRRAAEASKDAHQRKAKDAATERAARHGAAGDMRSKGQGGASSRAQPGGRGPRMPAAGKSGTRRSRPARRPGVRGPTNRTLQGSAGKVRARRERRNPGKAASREAAAAAAEYATMRAEPAEDGSKKKKTGCALGHRRSHTAQTAESCHATTYESRRSREQRRGCRRHPSQVAAGGGAWAGDPGRRTVAAGSRQPPARSRKRHTLQNRVTEDAGRQADTPRAKARRAAAAARRRHDQRSAGRGGEAAGSGQRVPTKGSAEYQEPGSANGGKPEAQQPGASGRPVT